MDNVLSEYGIEKDRQELEFYRRVYKQNVQDEALNIIKERAKAQTKEQFLKELINNDPPTAIRVIIEVSAINEYFKEQLIRQIVLKWIGGERVLWVMKLISKFKI